MNLKNLYTVWVYEQRERDPFRGSGLFIKNILTIENASVTGITEWI